MATRRSKQPLPGWLSAKSDGFDHRFIQVGNSLLLSKAFQELSYGAVFTYLCMAMESAGKIEYIFPRSAARKFGISDSSAERYIKELIRKGYITLKSSGRTVRQPNVYRFCFDWKQSNPIL